MVPCIKLSLYSLLQWTNTSGHLYQFEAIRCIEIYFPDAGYQQENKIRLKLLYKYRHHYALHHIKRLQGNCRHYNVFIAGFIIFNALGFSLKHI